MLTTRSLKPLMMIPSAVIATSTGVIAKPKIITVWVSGSPRLADLNVRGFKNRQYFSSIDAPEKSSYNHEHNHEHNHERKHEHDHTHSIFSGHVHSVHGIQNNPIISQSGGLKNPAIRITVIGLVTNLGMVIGKGIGGVVFNSQSLLADALHAVSDLVSDFLTLFTVTLSNRVPSMNFPLGYGKVETVGALGVSALLLVGGAGIGISGLETILANFSHHEWINSIPFIGGDHSHSHGGTGYDGNDKLQVADMNAAWLALGSIFIKEWLFRATFKIGTKMKSSVLIANAWHHRVDSLTSIVAMLTITGGNLLDLVWLDSVGGILVAGLIIKAGITTAKGSFMELLDRALPAQNEEYGQVKSQVEEILAQLNQGGSTVYSLHHLTVMSSGPNLIPNLGITTNQDLTLSQLNKVNSLIDQELGQSVKGVKGLHINYVLSEKISEKY
ncbi:hypothetical protein NADFUDRAFT_69994 [Nadsonia fulvescens var. elongata DSM 6958]|uniref:Cation efflux protein transmembrane domain-containing protein n=1 Tax=Nadsonia fulvescens var. elongata DSM 6958 TaxID=857566 RepID=A0A1E3PKR0_9ASCO|nr:hypothetical protein NADFUDRAFT_69994 [Nadsonia fulvescens var. elongata DSM 6958]